MKIGHIQKASKKRKIPFFYNPETLEGGMLVIIKIIDNCFQSEFKNLLGRVDNVVYIQLKSNFNPLENSDYAPFHGLISNFQKYVPLSF